MKSLAILILILGYLQNVNGDFSLTILLNEFNNGQGFLADGNHCSSFWFMGQQCNIQLSISVDYSTGVDDYLICNNENVTSINLGNVSTNANNVVFGEQTYGSWQNPQIFLQAGFYNGFRLCVVAQEATTGKIIDSYYTDRIESQRIDDFTYYSHERLNGTIDPTLILFGWTVQGDTYFTQPTRPPTTVTTTTPSKLPVDCQDAFEKKLITTSGVTPIILPGGTEIDVYCEVQGQTVQTVIQSRGPSGSTTYKFDILEYNDFKIKQGLPGNDTHFWMGLDNMNLLTTSNNYGLSIVACCGTAKMAEQYYHNFTIGDLASGYVLKGVADNGGVGLDIGTKDFGKKFATNDNYNGGGPPRRRCSASSTNNSPNSNIGGWWFGSCSNNLNGHYYDQGDTSGVWKNAAQCTLDQTIVSKGNGPGIELNNGPLTGGAGDFLNWTSATRIRMALFRGAITTSNFCST